MMPAELGPVAGRRRRLGVSGVTVPLTVVHGDLAEWNVHYDGDRLAGVLDFELTHLDSRPYELVIARTYRSPEATEACSEELRRLAWPLRDLEQGSPW